MRLIDADALPRHGQRGGLVHWKDIENAPTIDIEERLNDAYAHGWSDAEAKYHDAVEVVRCRECKHWICNPNTEEWGKCKWISDEQFDVVMNDDDFCSYGERRDSDDHTRSDE